MWIVVHFLNEDTVEAVPDIWYQRKNKLCAWPLKSKNYKKLIEKKDYPNEENYEWLPARILGRQYGTLEEARNKSKMAQFFSDLSTNEETKIPKREKVKKIESPPSLKPSKLRKTIKQNRDLEFDVDEDDSDKDPDYQPTTMNVPSISPTVNQNTDHELRYDREMIDTVPLVSPNKMQTKKNSYILNSPIGKILVTDTVKPYNKPVKQFQEDTNFILSPQHNTAVTPVVSAKKKLFPSFEYSGSLEFQGTTPEPNLCLSGRERRYHYDMTDTDFKNFVVSSLTKIKHEITDICSSVNSTHIKLDELENNSGQITVNQLTQLENGYNLDDYFPITNNEELKILNDKIQMDKELRLHLVSKLSLLVGTKDIGDSVRRLMGRMFNDKVLTEYSLQGKKKKKNFSSLSIYQVILDAL